MGKASLYFLNYKLSPKYVIFDLSINDVGHVISIFCEFKIAE